jgi:hypothetical protein
MPVFTRPPLNGISLSDALIEAAVVAPVDVVVLRTYEIRNYHMTPPLRLIASNANFTGRLEADAPANPGENVLFYASGVDVELLPESAEAGSPEIGITVTNVNGEISNLLEFSRGTFDTWEITERIYLSNDPTGPARLPVLTLNITSVSMNGRSANMKASFGDALKLAIPRLTFNVSQYPGLSAK